MHDVLRAPRRPHRPPARRRSPADLEPFELQRLAGNRATTALIQHLAAQRVGSGAHPGLPRGPVAGVQRRGSRPALQRKCGPSCDCDDCGADHTTRQAAPEPGASTLSDEATMAVTRLFGSWPGAVQRWPIPPGLAKPAPDPDEGLPTLPPGKTWAKPGFARQFLKNYDQKLDDKNTQMNGLLEAEVGLDNLKATAVAMQKSGHDELDRIRRNDIWPNWGTLGHALTAVGTIASCLEGSCLVGLALGVISLYDTDSGAAAGVAANCLPNPLKPKCGQAVVEGAASIGADRMDKHVTGERLTDKQRAAQQVEAGRKAQAHFDEALAKLQTMKDRVNDEVLFLKKAYEYARWGDEKDNPFDQAYKVETPV